MYPVADGVPALLSGAVDSDLPSRYRVAVRVGVLGAPGKDTDVLGLTVTTA